MGLPLSVAFASSGLTVVGIDSNAQKVSAIEAGRSYIEDVESSRPDSLVQKEPSATVPITACYAGLPTPLDEHRVPDLSYVKSGAKLAAPHISEGTIVVLESTPYPGTSRKILKPICEMEDERRTGEDFQLAFSP